MLISIKMPRNSQEVTQTALGLDLDLDITLEELKFFKDNEPVAWAAFMAGLERVGFILAGERT